MNRHGSLQTSRERNVCNFDNFMVCARFQFGFGSVVALYITCNYASEFARNVFSLPLVKSGSIFRDTELVSLGGWLSKRMYKRSKIMVKSISILIWSQLTPSYLLSVCRLRMHSDLGPSFQVITNLCSTSLSRLHVYFFLHLVQSDQVGPGTMCAVTLIKVQQYFFQYKSFPLGTFYFILNVLNFS